MHALSVKDLKKTYHNGITALKGVSFDVKQGDFFALLGPNGAGKSTLIGVLTSLVLKSSGSVSIFGHDIDKDFEQAKSCIGVVPQEFNFNVFEKVFNIVLQQAGYYGIPRRKAKELTAHYLKKLGLWDKRNVISRTLSGGMKRRLMIARALVHRPKMLVLDEPSAGVDIELRRQMWDFLQEINEQGTTIILTTHYLEEAEHLCRDIAIIDEGSIVENTSMSSFLQQLETERLILYTQGPVVKLPKVKGYAFWLQDEQTLEVEVPKTLGLSQLFEQLSKQGVVISSMRNKSNRLEELFLRLTTDNST